MANDYLQFSELIEDLNEVEMEWLKQHTEWWLCRNIACDQGRPKS